MARELKGTKYFTHEVQERFLDQLVNSGGNIKRALDGIPITRFHLRRFAKENQGFNTRFIDALELGLDALEDEATRRAYEGVTKDKFYKTKKIGMERTYSDSLMKFLLEGRRREVFGKESKIKLEGGDSPIDVNALPEAVRDKIEQIQGAADKKDDT